MVRIDGELVAEPTVRLPLGSPLLTGGDGWFETVRVDDGMAPRLPLHVDRLASAALRSGVTELDASWVRGMLARSVADAPAAISRVRGTFFVDGEGRRRCWTIASAWDPPSAETYARGVELAEVDVRHPGDGAWGKTVSRQWAHTASRLAAPAEPVVVDAAGHVVESANAAIVWRRDDQWFCPPSRLGALPSVTLRALLDLGLDVRPDPVSVRDLEAVDAVVLLSSLRLAIGVRSLGARAWSDPDAWPRRLRADLGVRTDG